MSEIPNKNGEKLVRDKNGRFVKGHPPLEGVGHPLGQSNFKTDFDEVIEEIAKLNKITFSEARKILLKIAYSQAKSGQFPFWKEIMDRYYGKVTENIDLTIGKKIAGVDLDKLLDYVKNDKNKSLPEDKGDDQENTDLSGRDICE